MVFVMINKSVEILSGNSQSRRYRKCLDSITRARKIKLMEVGVVLVIHEGMCIISIKIFAIFSYYIL